LGTSIGGMVAMALIAASWDAYQCADEYGRDGTDLAVAPCADASGERGVGGDLAIVRVAPDRRLADHLA
jgi:hypothetical protein